jgi:hypothetical protein
LPLEPVADRRRPEEQPPVVHTATIPVRGRAGAGVDELAAEKEAHMRGCGECQRGPRVCRVAAGILTAVNAAVPGSLWADQVAAAAPVRVDGR